MNTDSFAARKAGDLWRSPGRLGQCARFAVHFIEMAIAMEIGMVVLGWALPALGQSTLHSRSPDGYAVLMTASMALPMAVWMSLRGHRWERTVEMAAAMTLPTVVLVIGSVAGLLPSAVVLSAMDTLMWAGMLGAMLVRWREYTGHHGRH